MNDSILHRILPFALWKIYLNCKFKYWNFQFYKENKKEVEKMRNKHLPKSLWENNIECANCGVFIPEANRKKFRACETGFNYCSDRCAEDHVNTEYKDCIF